MRKKGKAAITLWVEQDFKDRLDAKASDLSVPRSNLVENILRDHLGMPRVEPDPKTRKNLGRKSKKKRKK